MRVLLSAYACEPHKGSEPGVGWHWAVELARMGHEVWVLTRSNNAPHIAEALKNLPMKNLNLVYYDLPGWLKWWKRGRRGVHLYYFLWQVGVLRVARTLVKTIKFDVVHHVTFVSVRQPSFLGMLGIPFVFGPVAGGECAPMALRKSYPWRGWLLDLLRDAVNGWVRYAPLMRLTFATARRIYVTSEQTRQLLPVRYRDRAVVQLAIGSDGHVPGVAPRGAGLGETRILFVGQLFYLKGVHLALRAFALFLEKKPGARFTIVGSGPDEPWLRDLAHQLNVDHAVDWVQWLPRAEVMQLYCRHDLFLFPSLRDSGGMVVLEALASGLPVVCLDLGGPGVIVDATCGVKVGVTGRGETEIVRYLADAMTELSVDTARYGELCKGAVARSDCFEWRQLVATVYHDLEHACQ